MTHAKRFFVLIAAFCMTEWNAAGQATSSLSGLSNPTSFLIANQGAVMYETAGTGTRLTVGYARIEPNAGSTTPAGYLVFRYRKDGVLVSEATVPEVRPISSGVIDVVVLPRVNTGIAMVNPSSTDAVVTFYFTPGSVFCDCPNPQTGSFILPAHSQIAKWVWEFASVFTPSTGTMTFSSN